ncbi:hypothetical protein ASE38_16965 [Cellulomonas sp. Root930]|nr:hypothetical protein ASE38_16965 [Cellulomonas sp. Root930]
MNYDSSDDYEFQTKFFRTLDRFMTRRQARRDAAENVAPGGSFRGQAARPVSRIDPDQGLAYASDQGGSIEPDEAGLPTLSEAVVHDAAPRTLVESILGRLRWVLFDEASPHLEGQGADVIVITLNSEKDALYFMRDGLIGVMVGSPGALTDPEVVNAVVESEAVGASLSIVAHLVKLWDGIAQDERFPLRLRADAETSSQAASFKGSYLLALLDDAAAEPHAAPMLKESAARLGWPRDVLNSEEY